MFKTYFGDKNVFLTFLYNFPYVYLAYIYGADICSSRTDRHAVGTKITSRNRLLTNFLHADRWIVPSIPAMCLF